MIHVCSIHVHVDAILLAWSMVHVQNVVINLSGVISEFVLWLSNSSMDVFLSVLISKMYFVVLSCFVYCKQCPFYGLSTVYVCVLMSLVFNYTLLYKWVILYIYLGSV